MSTSCNSPRSDRNSPWPADGHLVEEDVAAAMAACGCDRLMQRNREPALGPRLTTSTADAVHSTSGTAPSAMISRDVLVVVRLGHMLFPVDCSGGAT
jgi:hypothetical protein